MAGTLTFGRQALDLKDAAAQSLLTDVGALLWTLSVAFARSGALGIGVGVDHGASVFNPRMVSPMLAAVVFPVQLGERSEKEKPGGGWVVWSNIFRTPIYHNKPSNTPSNTSPNTTFNTHFLHHTSSPPPTQTRLLGEIAGAVGWPPPTILALQQLLTPIEVGRGTPIHPSKLIIELPQQR